MTSAWLTIDLIPVVLVWFFASRFARWFILFMAALNVALALYDGWQRGADAEMLVFGLLGLSVPIALAALLFLPASTKWFGPRGDNEVAVFA